MTGVKVGGRRIPRIQSRRGAAVTGKSKLSAVAAAIAATDHETMRARTEGGGEMR